MFHTKKVLVEHAKANYKEIRYKKEFSVKGMGEKSLEYLKESILIDASHEFGKACVKEMFYTIEDNPINRTKVLEASIYISNGKA